LFEVLFYYATIHPQTKENDMSNLFTVKNGIIAAVVILVIIIGYYLLKPAPKAPAPAAKPAVTAPATPAAPAKK